VKPNVQVVCPALVVHDGAAPDDPAATNTAIETATTSSPVNRSRSTSVLIAYLPLHT
jgi:hypothetical protein